MAWISQDEIDINVPFTSVWQFMIPLLKRLLMSDPKKRFKKWGEIITALKEGDIYIKMEALGKQVAKEPHIGKLHCQK